MILLNDDLRQAVSIKECAKLLRNDELGIGIRGPARRTPPSNRDEPRQNFVEVADVGRDGIVGGMES